ncbi:MAG TPA: PAS domain S-box protein [Opitutus sp.]|nr:PAS domain S-box protein [Opitutus sp.]
MTEPSCGPRPDEGQLHRAVDAGGIALKSLATSRLAALLITAGGSLVLLGWIFHLSALQSVLPGLATMKFNTALGFVLVGAALLLARRENASPAARRSALGLSVAAIALAALTLGEYAFGWNLRIDELVVRDPGTNPAVAAPGRMSLATAQCFVLLGLAVALIDFETRRGRRPADWLAVLGSLAGLVGVLGYLFGASSLYRLLPYSSMALHTSVFFVALGAGVLLARPERGLMATFTNRHVGGHLARLILPWAFVLGIGTAWLRLRGEKAGYYDAAMGTVILTLAGIFLLLGVVWFSAQSLNRLHAALEQRNLAAARLAAIVESSQDAVVGKSLDGIVTSWNRGAEQILGFAAGEMIGRPIKRIVPAELFDEEDRILARVRNGEHVDHFETRRLHKDGRVIDVSVAVSPIRDQAGRVVGASKVARDVSVRRRLDAQLQASLREIGEFKTALDEHAIVAITDPQGRITYVNHKFCAISKYPRDELLGQDHRLLNSGHHPPDFFRDLWATIGRGRIWHGEIRNRAKDGSLYWVDTTIVPFLDRHGRPRQYMAIRADITGIKDAQEELARSNQDLEQFAYVASHDLQEPLRAVAGCVQVLQRRYADRLDARADELIGHAVDGASRMQTLIEGLLAFSRVGTRGGEIQSTDAAAALDMALRNLATAIRENGARVTHDELPAVRADAPQLTAVFQNLVGNALKFRGAAPPQIHVGAQPADGSWIFAVRDNGIGIAPEFFGRIFAIFQRLHTRREYPGTGIGLSLCKKIVERHGGRIWVESTPGQGSTFYFSLPGLPRA